MIRFLILRFVFPLLIFFLIRSVLRSVVAGRARQASPRFNVRTSPSPTGTELKKDPVCGTYVSMAASVTSTVNGSVVHFCSPQCRDKFRAA
ncbi:MAG: YHS domain-containing protein [Acidobacteriia bacterium]|nr:YHS domain-containing protein [Terriglobia bacterium]